MFSGTIKMDVSGSGIDENLLMLKEENGENNNETRFGEYDIEKENNDSEYELKSEEEIEIKFNEIMDAGELPEEFTNKVSNEESLNEEVHDEEKKDFDTSEKREPNSKYESDGDVYETDDTGTVYKKNGEMLPNTEYSRNGHTYRTDEKGRIIYCDFDPKVNKDGKRNTKEQRESGGEYREENDDGGHIVAVILNGVKGIENLIPMRTTINRGDYKKSEKEIAKAIEEGKDVSVHVELEYDGDSQRPSKIKMEYTIDGKTTVVECDNNENSTELLDTLEGKIDEEHYEDLKNEIDDMKEDGADVSITSVKTEYDENGNQTKVTVGVLNESTGEKTYKVYESKQEA